MASRQMMLSLTALAVGAAGTAPAFGALSSNPGAAHIPWLRIILGLLLCGGLAWGAALLLRARLRLSGQTLTLSPVQGRRLQVVQTVKIGTASALSLASVDGREFLVATGQGQIAIVPLQTSLDTTGLP
jgi:hypothetical protein